MIIDTATAETRNENSIRMPSYLFIERVEGEVVKRRGVFDSYRCINYPTKHTQRLSFNIALFSFTNIRWKHFQWSFHEASQFSHFESGTSMVVLESGSPAWNASSNDCAFIFLQKKKNTEHRGKAISLTLKLSALKSALIKFVLNYPLRLAALTMECVLCAPIPLRCAVFKRKINVNEKRCHMVCKERFQRLPSLSIFVFSLPFVHMTKTIKA